MIEERIKEKHENNEAKTELIMSDGADDANDDDDNVCDAYIPQLLCICFS